MTQAGFEKVTPSDKVLYGPRKLLLCGFNIAAQSKMKTLLEMLGVVGLPLVWVGEDQADARISDLMQLDDGSGAGHDSALPRALVVAGVSQQELHQLMAGCRKAGMRQALWAVLTPTSEQWRLGALLRELAREHAAMAARKGEG